MRVTSSDALRGTLAFVAAATLTLMLSACGGADGSTGATGATGQAGTAGLPALTVESREAAGLDCAAGGVRIDAGLDRDANGRLDAAEISSTQFVCNGSIGATGANGLSTLVRTAPETAGANCAGGGSRIDAGLDLNGDGVLQAGEITTTSYVCRGATGAIGSNGSNGASSLVVMTVEAAGSNCTYGGNKMQSGVDADGDGLLDHGETITTGYACNGATGAQGAAGTNGSNGTNGTNGTTGATGSAGPGITWSTVTATVTSMTPNTGYVANSATAGTPLQLTLPNSSTLTIGDLFSVSGGGADGWQLAAAAGSSDTILTKALPASYKLPLDALDATTAPLESHRSVAVSNNGLVVVSPSLHSGSDARVWVSHDGGRTWSGLSPSAGDFFFSAMSADGKLIVVTDNSGSVYRSIDSGATFAFLYTVPSSSISGIASSADGSELAVTQGGSNQIMVSHDSGGSWSAAGPSLSWGDVTMSADGSHIVAVSNAGSSSEIYVSTDFGATFSGLAATQNGESWKHPRASADGKHVLVVGTKTVWLSTDWGQTYRQVYTSPGFNNVNGVGMSGDGQTLAITMTGDTGEGLESSTDGGNTWVSAPNGNQFQGLALDYDGDRLFAAGGTVSTAANDRTSLASAGGWLRGTQGDNITLQYLGSNTFVPVSYYSQYGDFVVN